MARRSARLSQDGQARKAHKRVASTEATTLTKRTRTRHSKNEDKREAAQSEDDAKDDSVSPEPEGDSDFEAAAENVDDSVSDEAEDDDFDDEDTHPKRKRPIARKGATKEKSIRDADAWKPGVKAGLGPGKELIIKKPKPRPAGKTPYSDDTLHPNTLEFLRDLKANNRREWLKANDAEFRQAERDWHSFVESLTAKMIDVDDTIPELPIKDIVFRIYRDISMGTYGERFDVAVAADKRVDSRTIKHRTSVGMLQKMTARMPVYPALTVNLQSRTGRKATTYAVYYLQVAPDDETLVAGGLYQPESQAMAALRADIDRHPHRIRSALMDDGLRKEFFSNTKDQSKAINAFLAMNDETALKTKPKGYDADHVDIDLLRLRRYTVSRKLKDEEIVGPGGLGRIVQALGNIKPLVTYLNSVVMPDPEDEGEDDEGEDESENEEE